jgi:hypothetical protein
VTRIHIQRRFGSAALALLLVIGLAGCDGYTAVSGHVVDPKGKPIPGASVKLTQQTDSPRPRSSTATTGEDGSFSVGTTHAPSKSMPFLLEVEKEGFEKHTEKVVGTARYEREITLQPARK